MAPSIQSRLPLTLLGMWMRLLLHHSAIAVMRKTHRRLTYETAHQCRKRVVAGYTKLMLNIDHCLSSIQYDLLIVITDALQLGFLIKCGRMRLGDELLQQADDTQFNCCCGHAGSTLQISPCIDELCNHWRIRCAWLIWLEWWQCCGCRSRRLICLATLRLIAYAPLLQRRYGLGQSQSRCAQIVQNLENIINMSHTCQMRRFCCGPDARNCLLYLLVNNFSMRPDIHWLL